jgi:hypothetical protein
MPDSLTFAPGRTPQPNNAWTTRAIVLGVLGALSRSGLPQQLLSTGRKQVFEIGCAVVLACRKGRDVGFVDRAHERDGGWVCPGAACKREQRLKETSILPGFYRCHNAYNKIGECYLHQEAKIAPEFQSRR